ncbi:MAG TPA: hypothetical protein VLG69_04405 [Candidatus Andersenbacteria bacterium]|nr:hypothetical protein [Candidatus Andersenbacteria bacterium]
MVQTVSPSATMITAGQIAKFLDLLAAALRKSGLPSEQTQQVIETQGDALTVVFVGEVRKRVEAISDMIVRHAKVDRGRTPQKVLDDTGRKQYTTREVVDSMPHGDENGEEVDVHFFKLGHFVNDVDLDKEFELRGLKPADPYSLAAVNEEDPDFADKHPNRTHWKDANGKWCFATFDGWVDERSVNVDRVDDGCDEGWWFAGLRK